VQRSVTPPTVADGARPITRLLGALGFADNDVVANEIALNWDPFLDMGGLYDDLRLVSQSIDFDTKNPEDGSGAAGACRRTNGGYYGARQISRCNTALTVCLGVAGIMAV